MRRIGKCLIPLLAVLCFLLGLNRLEEGRTEEGRRRLENTLRRTAAAGYALDGAYPPSLDHMRQRFGLYWDEEAYVVHYEIFAANLAPEITVMERLP